MVHGQKRTQAWVRCRLLALSNNSEQMHCACDMGPPSPRPIVFNTCFDNSKRKKQKKHKQKTTTTRRKWPPHTPLRIAKTRGMFSPVVSLGGRVVLMRAHWRILADTCNRAML